MAGAAFKDAETVKVLSNFIPILVDGDVEKEVVKKYGVSGYPNTVFASAKGEAIKTVTGAVPTPQFRNDAEAALKKAGKPKPSKDYKTLTQADADLTTALEKNQVSKALAAIAKIEKVGRDCSITERAVAEKAKLLETGLAAVATARADFEGGDAAKATKALKEVLRDYRGADDVEKAAREVLAAIEKAAEETGE